MRIYLESITRPCCVAETLKRHCDTTLPIAMDITARLYGYDDWSELVQVTQNLSNPPSLPDEMCSPTVNRVRFVFQLRQVDKAFADFKFVFSLDQIHDLVEVLGATRGLSADAYQYAELTEKLFPSSITMTVPSLPENLVGFRSEIKIGGDDALEFLEEVSVTSFPLLDSKLGIRTAEFNWTDEDAPNIVIVFQVQLTVEENIVTKLTLSILDGYCDDDALESDPGFVAQAFLGYLKSIGNLNVDLGEFSLPYEGMEFELSDKTPDDELDMFFDVLDEAFEDAVDSTTECPFPLANIKDSTAAFPDYSYLRISSYLRYEREERLLEDSEPADRAHAVMDEVLNTMIDGYISELPTAIANHLVSKGHKDLADFALAHTLDSPEEIKPYLKFVTSLNTALAISLPQYVFVAHLLVTRYIHFIESDLNHDDEIYSSVDSVRNKQFVHAAEDMGCAPLAKIYRENDVEAINELANAGGEEFMIDRLQSEDPET